MASKPLEKRLKALCTFALLLYSATDELIYIPIKIFHSWGIDIISVVSGTRHHRQVTSHGLVLHLEEVLSDQADLRVVMRSVQWIAVLQGKAIGMINENVAVRNVMHE